MKLGFLLFDYFPYGGLQRDCRKVAEVCAARGHAVTLFTRTWEGEQPTHLQVEVFGRRGFSNVSRNRAWLRQLAAELPRRGLDGIIGFNKLPGLDVYYGSDPCYVAKSARLKPAWHRWLPRYRHFSGLERSVFAAGTSTQILLLTPHEIPLYQKHYGTEAGRFHVLPPGVGRRLYSEENRREARTRLRAEHGWTEGDRVLLFVGSGFRIKGLDRAISALAALPTNGNPKAHLVVIGQGRSNTFALQARRAGVGARVHFLGGRLDVPDWMLAADLCLHPAYSESAGMILLEALTCGLPVLTTDTCGYALHVVRARGGEVLSSPFRQEDCNRVLAGMLREARLQEWRANGLAYAAREDLYSCHEKAADLIEETVRRKQARTVGGAAPQACNAPH